MHQDFPVGESCPQPQWEGNYYESQWGENACSYNEENTHVEDSGITVSDVLNEIARLNAKYFSEDIAEEALANQTIEDYPNPSSLQHEFLDTTDGMEIEDNVQHQLICELMNKLVKINTRLDKLMDRQEAQFQTIKLEVVEPPSPTYEPPHINFLTYMAQMHNDKAQSPPIDDGYSEESYEDEIDDMNDIESLGGEHMN